MSEDKGMALMIPEQTLDLAAAVAMQQAYLDACKALLSDEDYSNIKGTQFRKRSGWAKLRRAFCVTCEIVSEERVEINDDWGYLFVVSASLPNARHEDADGSCMASEFAGQRIAPTLPNVRAKALTRAKSRATSDILGAGVVSAEEIGNSTRHWIDGPKARKAFWAWTKGTLKLSEEQVHDALGVESVHDFQGTMNEAKAVLESYAMDTEEK